MIAGGASCEKYTNLCFKKKYSRAKRPDLEKQTLFDATVANYVETNIGRINFEGTAHQKIAQ